MKKLGYKREINTLIEDIDSEVTIDTQKLIDKLLQKKHRRTKG